MKRALSVFFKGVGMGAADAVPGVSGGTIAFVTGIYEELIDTIKRFGPSAIGVWRKDGFKALWQHLNLAFLLPLVVGIFASLITVAHLVTWLMDTQPLLLNAFFFGLVVCSGVIVARRITEFKAGYLIWLALGLVLASKLPSLLPAATDGSWVLVAGGAIAISAMLLPGVSGSFLLLTMGLYGTVMTGIKSFDVQLILLFGSGCAIGLFTFSRVLSWLFRHHHTATLMLLTGFILGSLPVLWPWRTITDYRIGPKGEQVPLDYQFMMPDTYTSITGEPAQLWAALAVMLAGILLVWFAGERSGPDDSSKNSRKEQEHA
ncbi:DUF368 domain-containing protein [Cobetia crustatorum]|uniref:DUF368 domain-containing protein n=1 Tax=Cobetia crustatorum TaxID=553385 RepID=A0A558HJ60_9GAMM|nr:DUF368 domain-containing protein [Cobetia crustatorum]TVU69175.1 DUF368 domain-containing protein [Cobetia crustatorum]